MCEEKELVRKALDLTEKKISVVEDGGDVEAESVVDEIE